MTTAIDNRKDGVWDSGGRLMRMVWRDELVTGSVYDSGWAIDGGQEGPGIEAIDNRLELSTEDVGSDLVSHLGPESRQANVIAVVRIDQDREGRFDELVELSSVPKVDLLSATRLLLGGVGGSRRTNRCESPYPLWCQTHDLERHVATHADPCECEPGWCVSEQSFCNAAD
ncbi:MAG TPA: hypothetical protein VFC03_20990 [Acidimicrobiales bacterium]|nr:hypothetical protein [Acidimicrobiales bacterium]